MLKKWAIVGGIVAVAGLGVGGAAWAGSDAAAPQAVAATSPAGAAVPAMAAITTGAGETPHSTAPEAEGRKKGRQWLARRLERVSHAQWVGKNGKTGAFVTHDTVRGRVSAVSVGSISVTATDGTPETFVVNSSTKVHVKGGPKPATIAQVKVGDAVAVLGNGAGTMTATRIIDRGTPKPTAPASAAPTTAAPTTS